MKKKTARWGGFLPYEKEAESFFLVTRKILRAFALRLSCTKMLPWGAGVEEDGGFFAPEGVQGYVERGEKATKRRYNKKENRPLGRFSTL